MDYSHEVQMYVEEISGSTTDTIVAGLEGWDVQVLSVAMQQSKDVSDTQLICGTDLVAQNYGKDLPQIFFHYHCDSEDLYIGKTGNDEATVIVLYATTSQHEYLHTKNIGNQLTYGDQLFIAGILVFFVSLMAWRILFRLKR